eukprot:2021405-Prymnesium_polylepis.1
MPRAQPVHSPTRACAPRSVRRVARVPRGGSARWASPAPHLAFPMAWAANDFLFVMVTQTHMLPRIRIACDWLALVPHVIYIDQHVHGKALNGLERLRFRTLSAKVDDPNMQATEFDNRTSLLERQFMANYHTDARPTLAVHAANESFA